MIFDFEFVCSCVCVGFCLLHTFVSFLLSIKNGKRLSKLCDDCHLPIYEGEKHFCVVSSSGKSISFSDCDLKAFADLLEKLVNTQVH